MFSTNTKILTIAIAAISVLAFASILNDSSDADPVETEYSFYLLNTVEGEDSTHNGWISATGTTVVDALVKALTSNNIPFTGFTSESESIFFSDSVNICSWTNTYKYTEPDVYGTSYGIWNYNATDGWHMGNSVGLECGQYQPNHKSAEKDTAFAIVHQTMYNTSGATAKTLAVSTNAAGDHFAPVGLIADDYTVQLAPRDYKATPQNVVFGLAEDKIVQYPFRLVDNYPEQGLADVSGVYSGYGVTVVQALVNALNEAKIEHGLDYYASSIYFSDSKHINHWTTPYMPTDEIMWVNYAIWNYNAVDGWHLGNALGDVCGQYQPDHKSTEADVAFCIVHEPYYTYLDESAQLLGVSYDEDYNFFYPAGLLATADYGIQTAPRDLTATIENVIFGLEEGTVKEYTFILDCSVDGKDKTPNGTHIGYGTNAAYALINALNWDEVDHNLVVDETQGRIYFGSKGGIISDWTNTYDYTKTDVYGESYGIWNYNATDGWHMGNSVGLDCGKYQPGHTAAGVKDYVIAIVYQTMYNTSGPTAKTMGASTSATGEYLAPVGLTADEYTVQLAPRDYQATPDKVVFGLADDVISEYTFVIQNANKLDDSINGLYTGYGTNAAYALINALNWAEVSHTLVVDESKGRIYFGKDGIISDWTNTYNYTLPDVYGESYAIWNYNATDGWHSGNSVGLDCGQYQPGHTAAGVKDYVIAVVYQTMYNTTGATAKTLAVSTDGEGNHFAPVGMTADDYTVQLAPRDYKATPQNVVFGLAEDKIVQYPFRLVDNYPEQGLPDVSGVYSGYGVTIVQALVNALNEAGIEHGLDYYASSIYFSDSKHINHWTTPYMPTDEIMWVNYAIWNYNAVDGWHLGNALGDVCGQYQPDHKSTEKDIAFTIVHEPYYNYVDESAQAMGVSYDEDYNFFYPAGLLATADYGIQTAPRDRTVTIENVIFGPDKESIKEYTFILDCSVDGKDKTPNGTYTGYGTNAAYALINALNWAEIEHNLVVDEKQGRIYFGTKGGIISDWTNTYDYTKTDVYGESYGIWNYNATDGWHMGNSVGLDCGQYQPGHTAVGVKDYVIAIVYQTMYNPAGATAKTLAVTSNDKGEYFAPVGFLADEYTVQLAPRDYKATPQNVVFGLGDDVIKEYTFILLNTVTGEDKSPNGTYIGYGVTPVQALTCVLNSNGIANKMDYWAESVWFSTGMISDWSSTWDMSATDIVGANYSIWNYNAVDGWHKGNSLGLDCGQYQPDHKSTEKDTAFFLIHETIYVANGPSAVAMGVTLNGDVYQCPEGLMEDWGSIYLDILDKTAAPNAVAVQPYSCIYLDLAGGVSDVSVVGGKVGAAVGDIATPTKDGCTFLKWDPEVPATMPEDSLNVKAVWGVQPVVKDDEIDVDLSEDSSFVMPDTEGKSLNVDLSNNASVVLSDTSSIAAGSTVTASIEPVANPSSVEGTAYEFVFEAEGTPITGTIQVTVSYNGGSGKIPVVYYYNGTDVEEMKVVSYTSSTVTFETTHNSTYIIGVEDGASNEMAVIFAFAMLAVMILVVVVTVTESRKLEQN